MKVGIGLDSGICISSNLMWVEFYQLRLDNNDPRFIEKVWESRV